MNVTEDSCESISEGRQAKRDFHCVSQLLRRSEGEEEAAAYFGRNDNAVACAVGRTTMLCADSCTGRFDASEADLAVTLLQAETALIRA